MKQNINKSTLNLINDKTSLSTMTLLSKVSSPISTMKVTSESISNTVATILAFQKITSPLYQISKLDIYTKIAQTPNLCIPKISRIAETISSFQNNIKKLHKYG